MIISTVKIKKLKEQQQDQLHQKVGMMSTPSNRMVGRVSTSSSSSNSLSPPASRKIINNRGVAMDDFNDEDDSDVVFK